MPGRCWTLRMDGSKKSSRLKRGRPAATSPWRIVPPPQRFSTRIGCIQSAIDFREFSPTAAGFLPGPRSPASLMRRVRSASSFPRERRIGTDERPAVCPTDLYRHGPGGGIFDFRHELSKLPSVLRLGVITGLL